MGSSTPPIASKIWECGDANALPGTDVDILKEHKQDFSGLSLEDFIIPSVKGWKDHGENNNYIAAMEDGKLVNGPLGSGAVNIPVCYYLGNKVYPGTKCPKLEQTFRYPQHEGYESYDAGELKNSYRPNAKAVAKAVRKEVGQDLDQVEGRERE